MSLFLVLLASETQHFLTFFFTWRRRRGILLPLSLFPMCRVLNISDLNLPIPVCDVLNIRVTLLYFPMPMSLMDCVKPNRVDILMFCYITHGSRPFTQCRHRPTRKKNRIRNIFHFEVNSSKILGDNWCFLTSAARF